MTDYKVDGITADEFIKRHGHGNLCGLMNLPTNDTTHDELKNWLLGKWAQDGIFPDNDGILVTFDFEVTE